MPTNGIKNSTETGEEEMNKIRHEHWCSTKMVFEKLKFIWTINDFNQFKKETREEMLSDLFPDNSNFKWRLKLLPFTKKDDKEYVGLFLVSYNSQKVETLFKLSLLSNNNNKSVIKSCESIFHEKEIDWGYKSFISRDLIFQRDSGFLPDNKLTISCEIDVLVDIVNVSGQLHSTTFKFPPRQWFDSLKDYLKNKFYCDVNLCAEGKIIEAHKIILAAHSKVFAAMFQHDMLEKKSNHIDITDVSYDVLKEVIEYMYTGEVENSDENTGELLAAANKYDLDKLKVICEETLFKNLKIENAIETLILADMHNVQQLKLCTMDFIISKNAAVMETPEWKLMFKERPQLSEELTRKLFVDFKNGIKL